MGLATSSALDDLWRAYAESLWRAVFAYTRDPDVTNDAVAEAFAQCIGRGEAVRSPKAWLWQAAFKIAAGELQRSSRGSAITVEPTYEMPERAWDLIAALAALPERQRAVMVLHYYGGYLAREIAPMVGCSSATVRVHLSQGRTRLRTYLEEDHD